MNKALLVFSVMLLYACAPTGKPPHTEAETFMNKLAAHCGNAYRGQVIFPADGTDPFAGEELVMHVQACSDTAVMIPFTVGKDKSRTWVIRTTPEGLQLKHDHRHEDGTPDEVTMYGGVSGLPTTDLIQRFPADAHTARLIPAAATNEWTLAISPDGKTFSYILKRDNKMRFQADFDLTKPL